MAKQKDIIDLLEEFENEKNEEVNISKEEISELTETLILAMISKGMSGSQGNVSIPGHKIKFKIDIDVECKHD